MTDPRDKCPSALDEMLKEYYDGERGMPTYDELAALLSVRTLLHIFGAENAGQNDQLARDAQEIVDAEVAALGGTPAATWRVNGEPDPHGAHYDGERASLAMGHLTDDEMANAIFMNCDANPSIAEMLAGTGFRPIVWATAAKARIRWLSRALVKATAASSAAPQVVADELDLPEMTDQRIFEWAEGYVFTTKGMPHKMTFSRPSFVEAVRTIIAHMPAAAPVQAQEPVAWRVRDGDEWEYYNHFNLAKNSLAWPEGNGVDPLPPPEPLYRAPVRPVAVPDGWKLVPRELSEDHLREVMANINRKYKGDPLGEDFTRLVWQWAIYASPAAPAAQGDAMPMVDDVLSVLNTAHVALDSLGVGKITRTFAMAEIVRIRAAIAAKAIS